MRSIAYLFLTVIACFYATDGWALDKIRIGMGAFSPTNSAIWVAEERGFFKKHGLEAEAIFIGGGAARGVNALLAGDIQFATAGGGAVITSALKGADVVMVAAQNNKGVHRILVRPEINTPEEIKGKKIAITTFGSSSHAVLTMVLDVWKIRPDELQILQVGSSPTMLISLQKKLVDGAVLTDPSYFIAEDHGFRVIADLAKMNIHYLQSMMVSTRSYLRTNRDQATRVLRAYVEGNRVFQKEQKGKRSDHPQENAHERRPGKIRGAHLRSVRQSLFRPDPVSIADRNQNRPGKPREGEPQSQRRRSELLCGREHPESRWRTAGL